MGKISRVVYPELQTTQKLSFTGDNFLIWKLKLAFVLTDHHLPHLINPSPADPTWSDENPAAKWLILQTLNDSLVREFSKRPSPASVMESLLTRFNSLSKSSADIKLRRYRDCRMAAGTDINEHIFRMRAMANELEYGAGVKIPDEVQAVFILNGLPEDWEQDVESLLKDLDGGKENLSFVNFSRRLRALQDVKKLKNFNHGEKLKKKLIGPCYNCGKQGHKKSDCPDQGLSKQESASPNLVFPLEEELESVSEIIYLGLKLHNRLDYKGSHFSSWKRQIFSVLKDNEVEYVLIEPKSSDQADSASGEEAHHIKKWQADDFTCRHLILGTMEDDVFLSFCAYPTAKALMDALDAFFDSASTAQKLLRLKKYVNHHMAEDTPIIDHLTKMDLMVWKLQKAGADITSEMKSVFLIDSLPESWDQIVTLMRMNLSLDKGNGWSYDNVWKRVRDAGQLKEAMAEINDSRFLDNSNKKKKGY